jgi:Helix-turn-helix of DDE superfamily endonuclease
MVKYHSILQNSSRLRAMTGLTSDEFRALLPAFQQAFDSYLRDHTIDGYLRDGRRYTTYQNSPLPSIEDKLLFILTYLKNNPIQEMQGQVFGMSQSNVSKWKQLLHIVLNCALGQQDVLPARDAATLAAQLRTESPTDAESATLFSMTVQNAQ